MRRFISIKKINQEKKCFSQVYRDISSGNKVFFSCRMLVDKDKPNRVTIENSLNIQIGSFLNIFRPLLLILINKKFDVMWKEDLEMLEQRFLLGDGEQKLCIDQCPKLYREFGKFPEITLPVKFDKVVRVDDT